MRKVYIYCGQPKGHQVFDLVSVSAPWLAQGELRLAPNPKSAFLGPSQHDCHSVATSEKYCNPKHNPNPVWHSCLLFYFAPYQVCAHHCSYLLLQSPHITSFTGYKNC